MLKQAVQATGKAIRSLGQSLDRVGVSLEGPFTYTEHRALAFVLVFVIGWKRMGADSISSMCVFVGLPPRPPRPCDQ